jgi:hypothetical protein
LISSACSLYAKAQKCQTEKYFHHVRHHKLQP